ncbi:MAG: imidazole glycerol phosphate synthase subunit HisF [Acidobacteriota bacterium]
MTRWLRDEPCRRATSSPPSSDRASSVRRVVPCLDVRDGRVLKGVQFSGLRDVGDPAELAALHERHGADEIVVLDIGATPSRRDTQVETVRRVRAALRIPLTAGGGVRGVDDARALLTAGADKVTVNTAAVRRPELLAELASAFGRQCVVLAVDVRRRKTSPGSMPRWEVLVSGGHEPTGRDALEWIAEATELGAGEVLLTSWDRDGTRAGCDLASLDATRRVTTVPLIASGGIGTAEHVVDAVRAGADAVLAASVLHDRELTVNDLKQALAAAGLPTRPPLEPVMNEEVP